MSDAGDRAATDAGIGDAGNRAGGDAETGARSDAGPDVALGERARAQLVEVAADVLGALPAERIPAPLRAIARFTPSRRGRLGASVIAATLDTDAGFRAEVLDPIEQSNPALVTAVRDGAPLPASDPSDVAAVAYLVRADGWTDLVAADQSSVQSEPGDGERVARLEAALSEARAALRRQRRKADDRADAERAELADELAEARRQLRRQGGRLAAAERELTSARNSAAEATERLSVAEAAHAAQRRRLQSRVEELERSLESARRDQRLTRDLDEARLWLLVDTIVQSAAGLRRELSLPPPSVRPADVVGQSDSPVASRPTVRHAGDVAPILALPNLHLIIDGYNVTMSGYGDLALADQRARLIGELAAMASRHPVEVTVAFDGATPPPAAPAVPRGLRVLFSKGEIADDLIRRLVAAEPPGRPVAVVTSDQAIVTDVRASGAWTIPSEVFLASLSGR